MEKEQLTTEEQQVLDKIEKQQARLYLRGKIIVYVIAIVNALGAVVSVFTNFNFFSLIIQLVLSIALLGGFSWARYFFAVRAGISAFLTLPAISEAVELSLQPGVVAYLIVMLVFSIASSVVLFASKAVSEFLYVQKNG